MHSAVSHGLAVMHELTLYLRQAYPPNPGSTMGIDRTPKEQLVPPESSVSA
jgi:hypothetical protein